MGQAHGNVSSMAVLLRQGLEVDGAAGLGGEASGIEDLHHDEVGVESAEVAVRSDLFAQDGREVVD